MSIKRKYNEKEPESRGKITKEMLSQFWDHSINPITGFKVIKDPTPDQIGQTYSEKGDGPRYAHPNSYQSPR